MTESKKRYGRTLLRLLLILLIVSATIWKVYSIYEVVPEGRAENLLSAIAGYALTVMTVLFTTMAILMSIANSRLVNNMAKTGHYKNLVDSLTLSAMFFLVCSVVSGGSLYLSEAYEQLALAVASGLIVGALATLVHSGYKFYQVLMYLHTV